MKMSYYIRRLYSYLSQLFVKEKNDSSQELKTKLPPSRYCTPLRHPSKYCTPLRHPSKYSTPLRHHSHTNINNFKTFSSMRQLSNPEGLNKPTGLPTSTPLFRSSSHTSLMEFGSGDNKSFRSQMFTKNRGLERTFKNRMNKQMDLNYALQMSNKKAIPNTSIPSFCNRGFKPSSEDPMETDTSDYYDNCEKRFPSKKKSHLKNIQHSHFGFPHKRIDINSKIPVLHHQRGCYTLTSRKANSKESNTSEDRAESVNNWRAYRTDTNAKFECLFRNITKMRHTIGNQIDSTTHLQWMQMAGINVDKEASMFKQFAGGRVVLTLGEYKFLIGKICSTHDLEYWDVLRKMATFQDEEPHY